MGHNGNRLHRAREEVSLMLDSLQSESSSAKGVVQHDVVMAIFSKGYRLRKITPKASNGHEFILVAIDYFTKWVEVVSFSVLKAKHVARFIESNSIYRYGVPHEIILDNSMHFEDEVQRILQKYGVKNHKSSPY